MFLKLPLYWSYNRVIQKIFNTVLIIESVLIIETKEYIPTIFEDEYRPPTKEETQFVDF